MSANEQMLANAIRAHLAEFGIVTARGVNNVLAVVERLTTTPTENGTLPDLVALARAPLLACLRDLRVLIKALEVELLRWHRSSEASRRLETIPGFGFATAMTAIVPDPTVFKSGRELAAWLGLTPRQNSSGGKERLGRITKMGDGYLRTLLVIGATAVIRFAKEEGSTKTEWIRKLLAKKSAKVVAVVLANKMARIAWAVMTKKESYRVFRAQPIAVS